MMGFIERFGTNVINEEVPHWLYLLFFFVYLTIAISSLIFLIIINSKLRRTKVSHVVLRGIIGSYVAVSFFALNASIIRLSLYISNGNYALLYFSRGFVYAIGWLSLFYAANILVESLVNLPKRRRKVLQILLVIELFITTTGSIYSFALNFVSINSIFTASILIYLIIGTFAILGTTLILFIEGKNNPNSMSRLRLNLIATGLLAIIIDIFSLAGAGTLILLQSPFLAIWHQIITPMISIVTNLYFMFAFYYSIFTPVWLQKVFGLIPPSFYDLLKKQQMLQAKQGEK